MPAGGAVRTRNTYFSVPVLLLPVLSCQFVLALLLFCDHSFLLLFFALQDCWYGGTITKYHRRKRRHRVEYDDGDHEWINLQDECDRVQVQHEDGLWSMVRVATHWDLFLCCCLALLGHLFLCEFPGVVTPSGSCDLLFLAYCLAVLFIAYSHFLLHTQYTMYQSEAMQNEHRKRDAKRDKENYQQQAFRDANQWRSFLDDISHEVMFLSQITGEIRAGLPDALSWVVQVRGCFYFNFCVV